MKYVIVAVSLFMLGACAKTTGHINMGGVSADMRTYDPEKGVEAITKAYQAETCREAVLLGRVVTTEDCTTMPNYHYGVGMSGGVPVGYAPGIYGGGSVYDAVRGQGVAPMPMAPTSVGAPSAAPVTKQDLEEVRREAAAARAKGDATLKGTNYLMQQQGAAPTGSNGPVSTQTGADEAPE